MLPSRCARALLVPSILALGCGKAAPTNSTGGGAGSASAAAPMTTAAAPPPPAKPAAPTGAPTGAPSASGGAAAAAPARTSLDLCQRIQKGGLGKLCEAKPPIPPSVDSAQLTFSPSAKYPRESFAAFMTFKSAAELEQALAAFKGEKVGKNRKPPLLIANAKALVLVAADGEVPDAERLKAAVSGL